MCQLTQAARWVLGIRPYVCKSHYLLRYGTTRNGARGVELNGTAAGQGVYGPTYGLTREERQRLEALIQEHRIIRQMLTDMRRLGGR